MGRSSEQLWARVRNFIAANQAVPARAVLESIVARDPTDAAAHLFLAALYATDDHLRAATGHVLAAAASPPATPELLGDLVAALIRVGRLAEAHRLLALPMIADSQNAQVLARSASQQQLIGDHAAALGLVERARSAGAAGRDFQFQRAVQLAFNGDLEGARVELEQCIQFDPPIGRAFVQLARTRKQTPQSNHLGAIGAALRIVEPGSEDDSALEFARYKELEDLRRHAEAWQALSRANALMHTRLPHDSMRESTLFKRLAEVCARDFMEASQPSAQDGPAPIFVIGMARSGTTVLERMLGNHSRVTSAGELGEFPRALAYATDHNAAVMFDDVTLARLAHVDWREVGALYLEQSAWRASGKPFFVDKLPRNWMLAGMIHKALPHAKILHLVRDPMDVCFSNWRAYFGPGQEYAYAYDLEALSAHYRQYVAVMAHWRSVMPGAILDVPYARLVREPEATARDVFAFCGLGWEPGITNLAGNVEPSATLSMQQVRGTIHVRAFGEWEPYAAYLGPLQEAIANVSGRR